MKKIITLLFVFLLALKCSASEVSMIYINGSNNNDEKMRNWFFEGINKFHPVLKREFENDEYMQRVFLQNNTQKIAKNPVYFFWGNMSQNELAELKADLEIMDLFSPRLAQLIRRAFALIIHDAIWVSRGVNMYPILQVLHESVMKEYKKGNQSVLLGYSAGTFVSYQYALLKLPYMSKENIMNIISTDDKQKQIINKYNFEPTCADALLASNAIGVTITDMLAANQNYEKFEDKISNLNSYTDKYCVPKDAVKGIINYACPIALFYSDPSDPNSQFTKATIAMYKFIIENGFFWLTVNWSEDPMGYPVAKNLTISEMKSALNMNISPILGFFYDKSDTRSRHTVFTAHTSYWRSSKKFARTIIKAFVEGRELFGLY